MSPLSTYHVFFFIVVLRYGPFEVRIDRRQTRNTWLIVRTMSGKNREIRKVMQKYDLKVNRLKRISYGPYKVGSLMPGSVVEQ